MFVLQRAATRFGAADLSISNAHVDRTDYRGHLSLEGSRPVSVGVWVTVNVQV